MPPRRAIALEREERATCEAALREETIFVAERRRTRRASFLARVSTPRRVLEMLCD